MKAMILALLIGGFSPYEAFTAEAKQELRIGITQEFDNLNPIITNMLASFYLVKLVNRQLMIVGEKGQLIPQLAETVPSFENKLARFVGDGENRKLVATWKIRPQAKWGDGTPVTCDDLKFSVEVALSGSVPVPELREYDNFEKIDVQGEDRKTCVITYKQAKWNFDRPGLYLLPKHLEESVFKKHGKKPQGYENNTNYSTNPTLPGLYHGPYRITEIKFGSHIIVEPNPYFYGEAPKIKKIILKLIPNTATLEANLISGNIDMISFLGLEMDQALKFDKKVRNEKLPYKVNFKDSLVYEHIRLNMTNEILKDKNVRQALVYSINREELTEVLFKGKQPAALHFVSPRDPWFTDDPKKIKKYPYSLRTAKKLLDASGWKVGSNDYRYKNGKRLELSFATTAGRKTRELVQQYLKDQWKKVGIDINIKNFPSRVFFGEYLRKAQFDHMAMSANVSEPENDPREEFHSSSVPTKENNYSGLNRMKWNNPEVDRLVEKLGTEFSLVKRQALAAAILGHYTEDVPVIPLYYKADVSVTPKNLTGYFLTGTVSAPTNFVEKWSLQ